MKPKVLVDFHHSSLLRSLIMLFEDRLDMEVYRPLGLQWYVEGYWAINNNYDTAKQFLSRDQIPEDKTPPLNKLNSVRTNKKGIYYCFDPDGIKLNRACTIDFFKRYKFDYVVASIPAHVPLFKRLIRTYNPRAKLIIQVGNNWGISEYQGENVLASVAPLDLSGVNVMFYHQEFDVNLFKPTPVMPTKKIYSFVNVLENMPEAQEDFNFLDMKLTPKGYTLGSYGGQNRDGNMNGAVELANKMQEAELILHCKPGGDGFGHIIYNAYASGRPIICRSSQYRGQLAQELMTYGTYIDIDELGRKQTVEYIQSLTETQLQEMGQRAADQFKRVVNYEKEAEDIKEWLKNLT